MNSQSQLWSLTDGHRPVPINTVNNRSYGSRYDPYRETERWLARVKNKPQLKPQLALVIGVGCGYHLAFLRQQNPELPCIGIELDRELWELTRGTREKVLHDSCVECYCGPLAPSVLGEIIRRAGGAGGLWLLVFPAAQTSYPDKVNEQLRAIQSIINQDITSLVTEMTFAWDWISNCAANLPKILQAADATSLRVATAAPAIVIGASPSLDRLLEPLARLRNRVFMIACDTALQPLLASGIEPHLVVSVDSQQENLRHFCRKKTMVPLAVSPTVDPGIWGFFAERILVADTGTPLIRFLTRSLGLFPTWDAGGSVASIAYQLASQAGCTPIVFAAVDYCHTAGRTHARETKAHRELIAGINRFAPSETMMTRLFSDSLPFVKAEEGLLEQYAAWMNCRLTADKTDAYRVAQTGLLQLPIKPLAEFFDLPEKKVEFVTKPLAWQAAEVKQTLTVGWEKLRELLPSDLGWNEALLLKLKREPIGELLLQTLRLELRDCQVGQKDADEKWRTGIKKSRQRLLEILQTTVNKL